MKLLRPALLALSVSLAAAQSAAGMILVKIPGFPGDSTLPGYDDGTWFIADSFSFGVERELSESGEKGGTEDINIGVGELQECTISKSMDRASAKLAQFAINGNSPGTAEIHFVEVAGGAEGKPICYLKYKLDRCFVKSWSTSGDADDRPTEEVAFYYNKIAFQYYHTTDGKTYTDGGSMSWDNVTQRPWTSHGLPPTP
jgi:type VI protein secretion system component Hcp